MSYSPHSAPSGQQLRPLAPLPFVPLSAGQPPVTRPPVTQHSGLKIAVGAGCALVVLGLGVTVGSGKKDGAQPARDVTVTVTAKAAQAAAEKAGRTTGPTAQATAPAGPDATVSQGSYRVGKDIAAGTYRTGGPAASDMPLCYWARAKDSSGTRESILANGTPKGPARVNVHTGETFETNGCRRWTKVG
ncbi:hypothetical protein Sgleb_64360 [Streptomyces glebosus]|uniref:Uncharacterized protein n=1 Tax=Streptomyces glebosus TaxID=249580 RepID=A0A640T3U4_9ACTN|nr:hypothetical protein [Streptomyces glebosus]GFE18389.1 hypothetical protein Sgleb_64360 [Streptomyces glebosus]GHG58433.1 hypothetical protein GCM10010513_22590 [Streptomyces glebosus]